MNLVSVMQLSKAYGDKKLFEDLTFGIEQGDRIGLIGVNGTGKSSLLKVIAGVERADSGQVVAGNNVRIEYLPQNPIFAEEHTVLQSVFYGGDPDLRLLGDYAVVLEELEQLSADGANTAANSHGESLKDSQQTKLSERLVRLTQQIDERDAWNLEANAKNILTKLGISNFRQRVGELSGGQRKRVAMARALIQPSDLLILDEPTNHIDHETVQWLEEYLAGIKSALLLITHDRYFLDRVVNRIIELDKGALYSYSGNYAAFLEQKAAREESEIASEDKRQNLLRRELAWLQRGAKARSTKQKARVEFATALRDQQVDKPVAKLEIALGSQRLGSKVIELDHVSKSFEGRTLIKDLSLLIGSGERIGIVGPNGFGKSTLLNIIAGKIPADSGTVEIGSTVKMAYYTQESVDLNENQRVIEYIKEAAPYIKTIDGDSISAGQMLTRFLFPPNQQWTPIGKLSGGEKRRLYLLRILMSEPNVLLLDEPTNDLDVQTLAILEDYLDSFAGTVITVSHDRYFLDRAVDRLIAFEGGRGGAPAVIREFHGMYSEYQAGNLSGAARSEAVGQVGAPAHGAAYTEGKGTSVADAPSNAASRSAAQQSSRSRRFSYREQQEFDTIEDRIGGLEAKLEQVQAELAKGGTDFTRLQKLMDEQTQIEQELEAAVERWAELQEIAEEIERGKKK